MANLKKLKNGKWQVRWREERTRIQRAENFPSRELAQEKLRALHRGETDEARLTGITVGGIIDQWRKDRYPALSAGTRVRYENLIRLHMGSLLPVRIRDLTPARLDRWVDELRADVGRHGKEHLRTGFGHELTLLRAILGFYHDRWDDPYFVMPLKNRHRRAAELRNRPAAKPKDLSEADFLRFRARLEQDHGLTVAALATLQYYQALRISEAAALRWQDVRFDGRRSRLSFSQHVVYARSKTVADFIEPGLKNSEGGKEHPMLPAVHEILSRLAVTGTAGLVFKREGRQPGDPEFVPYRWVQSRYDAAFKRMGLPYRSTHVMRHGGTRKTFDETGGDAGIAAQQLGNRDRKTVEVYAQRSVHAFTLYADGQWDAAERVSALGVHSPQRHLEIVRENKE